MSQTPSGAGIRQSCVVRLSAALGGRRMNRIKTEGYDTDVAIRLEQLV